MNMSSPIIPQPEAGTAGSGGQPRDADLMAQLSLLALAPPWAQSPAEPTDPSAPAPHLSARAGGSCQGRTGGTQTGKGGRLLQGRWRKGLGPSRIEGGLPEALKGKPAAARQGGDCPSPPHSRSAGCLHSRPPRKASRESHAPKETIRALQAHLQTQKAPLGPILQAELHR